MAEGQVDGGGDPLVGEEGQALDQLLVNIDCVGAGRLHLVYGRTERTAGQRSRSGVLCASCAHLLGAVAGDLTVGFRGAWHRRPPVLADRSPPRSQEEAALIAASRSASCGSRFD